MKSLTRFEIVDAKGNPVTDAGLTVVRSSVPFPEVALVPDERGIVTVFLPEGRFTLRALEPGGRTAEITVETPAKANENVRIVLS
jgi:hypothetical protein